MEEEEKTKLECAICGDILQAHEVKRIQHSLYGVVVQEELRCSHCGRGLIYVRKGDHGGRYLLEGSYLSQLQG